MNFLLPGGISGETSFKEVSGLTVDVAPEEIVEGGELKFHHKLPTTAKYTNLTLKRGLVVSSAVRDWIIAGVRDFEFTPITVTVQLLNENASPLKSWKAYNVWPVKWEVSNFESETNGIAIETLELAYDYFEIS